MHHFSLLQMPLQLLLILMLMLMLMPSAANRWHYEMAQLNAIARTLIRLIFGTALMQGSYTEALTHFKTAAELCPARVIHRVEVGRTLAKVRRVSGCHKPCSLRLWFVEQALHPWSPPHPDAWLQHHELLFAPGIPQGA